MINKVILIGNVGTDPEVRSLETGVKFARLRLATTERIFDRQTNESRELTEWHTVTLWRGLADVVDKYVRKGSQLYIEGSLRTREWTDRENQKRYSTEIVASDMKILGRRSSDGVQQQQQGAQQTGYRQPSYQQPQQQQYQHTAAASPAPATPPRVPDENPDDLPF